MNQETGLENRLGFRIRGSLLLVDWAESQWKRSPFSASCCLGGAKNHPEWNQSGFNPAYLMHSDQVSSRGYGGAFPAGCFPEDHLKLGILFSLPMCIQLCFKLFLCVNVFSQFDLYLLLFDFTPVWCLERHGKK